MKSSKEATMSPEQSFQVINEMISRARNNYNNSISFYLLLWGVIMVITPWLDFFLQNQGIAWHSATWIVTASIGVIVGIVYGIKLGKEDTTTNLLDKAILYIWISCAVAFFLMFVLLFTGHIKGPEFFFISGIACLTSGLLLKFKPLIIGGVSFFTIACAFYLIPADYIADAWRPLMTLGILIGYIIPGVMLRNALKNV